MISLLRVGYLATSLLLTIVIFYVFLPQPTESAYDGQYPPSPYSVFLPLVYKAPPAPTPTITPTDTPTDTPTSTSTTTPTPTITLTPTITVTPTPGTVFIRKDRSYTSGSYTYVIGEVVNNTTSTIYSVIADAIFRKTDGSLAGTGTGYIYMTALFPGEVAPFKIFAQPATGWSNYSLSLSWSNTNYYTYVHIPVTEHTGYQSGSSYLVSGIVYNNTQQTLSYLNVATTLYGYSGEIVDVQSWWRSLTLAPSASAAFSSTFYGVSASTVAGYSILAESGR